MGPPISPFSLENWNESITNNTHIKLFVYCIPTFSTNQRFTAVNALENHIKDRLLVKERRFENTYFFIGFVCATEDLIGLA